MTQVLVIFLGFFSTVTLHVEPNSTVSLNMDYLAHFRIEHNIVSFIQGLWICSLHAFSYPAVTRNRVQVLGLKYGFFTGRMSIYYEFTLQTEL